MAICGIYKITSPSGKIYIGQAYDIEKRWSRYKNVFCHGQPYLYNSLKKYGPENHKFEISCECKEDELDERENYYIVLFDSFNSAHGMNLRSGGGRGEKLSDESKLKSGESQKQNWVKRKQNGTHKQSEETIAKRMTSYKETLKKKKELGIEIKYSDERRKNIGIKAKEYQQRLKESPDYYSEEQIKKRKEAARRGYLTQVQNGTTSKGKSHPGLYGKDNPFYGKTHTKETLDKIQRSRRPTWEKKIADGWKQSERHVAKRVEKQLGRKRTSDQIENIKAGVQAKKQDAGYRKRLKEKMSKSQKLVWEKKKANGFYSEEEKAKRSAIAYKRWANTGKTKIII